MKIQYCRQGIVARFYEDFVRIDFIVIIIVVVVVGGGGVVAIVIVVAIDIVFC